MPITFTLQPGKKGFIAGVVNATFKQSAYIEVYNDQGQVAESATFVGTGERVAMNNQSRPREFAWSFGAFTAPGRIRISISADKGNGMQPSQMVGPLYVSKPTEEDYPQKFWVWTVISEDDQDQDHDDCTIQVVQYE